MVITHFGQENDLPHFLAWIICCWMFIGFSMYYLCTIHVCWRIATIRGLYFWLLDSLVPNWRGRRCSASWMWHCEYKPKKGHPRIGQRKITMNSQWTWWIIYHIDKIHGQDGKVHKCPVPHFGLAAKSSETATLLQPLCTSSPDLHLRCFIWPSLAPL